MNCYSEPGKGSAFKIYLPVGNPVKKSKRLAFKLPASAPAGGHNEKVLVVDDEEHVREVAKLLLERVGYRVVTAVNGEEALVVCQQYRNEIAVVLMDMFMPVMDGEAAIAVLKQMLDELSKEHEGRQVKVLVAEHPDCVADPSLLKQVFANLLANAYKFTRSIAKAIAEIGCGEQNGERVYFLCGQRRWL